MTPVPTAFSYLLSQPWHHPLVAELLKLHGTQERPGNADNPALLEWARTISATAYAHDSIPWCGLTMGYVCTKARLPAKLFPQGNAALWALNWADAGFASDKNNPHFGDIVTKRRLRGGKVIGGHVFCVIAKDGMGSVWGIGGNQGDALNIKRFPIRELYSARSMIGSELRKLPTIKGTGSVAGKLV